MKFKTWTVGIAVLALATAPAIAEDGLGQWSYDQNVIPVGCDSCCGDKCCDDDCCGDSCCGDDCCGTNCGSCCGGGGLLSGMAIGGGIEAFSLSEILGVRNWDVGGWTQFGYHDDFNPRSTARGDGLAFNDVPDNLNLQQQWFYIGKKADGSRGVDFGFRADFIYGTDAQKTQAFGNPAGSFDEGFDHGVYGWAIPQLYGEIAVDDLSVKIGHFFTLVGYEVVPAPQNFFYSHSLTMFNSEPFTHTGVLSTYNGFENLTLYGGWTLGWDTGFDNVNSGNNFIGGFSAELTDAVNVTYINTYGNFGARDGGDRNSYAHSIVATVGLTNDLLYVAQSDMVDADDVGVSGTPGFIENNQFGINQYLIYQYNDYVGLGTRIEWWKNGGVSNYEYTSGVNIKLLDNLVVRPEYRKDWVPATGLSQENVAMDMILTY